MRKCSNFLVGVEKNPGPSTETTNLITGLLKFLTEYAPQESNESADNTDCKETKNRNNDNKHKRRTQSCGDNNPTKEARYNSGDYNPIKEGFLEISNLQKKLDIAMEIKIL